MCADPDCSLYVRDRKRTELGTRFESLTAGGRIARDGADLDAFLAEVLDGSMS
ncbi:hypothetical protein [Nonomuraea diastatica]|uniref:hypothetical protein n=1 Tax=Nonomuraea diastatica TaxID=1848329 RepID=UPI0014080271|nr:hypothetical protein [Nonomuraea diastatica]